jgi:putative ABC transport system permease protein
MNGRRDGEGASGRLGRPETGVRSLPGLAVALARQWWPQVAALAAACGVVAATIVGAVGVGDAMHRGLRRLAIDRLGGIEAGVVAGEFFSGTLAAELAARAADDGNAPAELVQAIVMEVSVEAAGGARRATRATLLACDDLAALAFSPPPPAAAAGSVLLNEPLAAALDVRPDQPIVLRLPRRSSVPADSPLGRRTSASLGKRLRVGAVLPLAGLGQFSLRPTQVTGPLVVASLATAREILKRDDAVNAVFAIAAATGGQHHRGTAADWIRNHLRPRLEDYGLAIDAADPAASRRLTSRRLILAPEVDRAAADVLGPLGGRPSLAFLANAMTPLDAAGGPSAASIPYSTVLGIDGTSLPAGDLVDDADRLLAQPGPDEILIDRWMADDLAAQGRPVAVGDRLELRFFRPETLHGRVEETAAIFRISGIAAMRGPAAARDMVPEVEGITDERSIADWDPPFPFDQSRVRTVPPHDEDDRYWKEHGTTPKAFISLAAARRLAASRFGGTTAWHLPRLEPAQAAATADRLAAALEPEAMGVRVLPLRDEALAAARGSTPFGSLFLALSSFVVVAGLLLEWLLFRLLVAARRRDVGLLAALGWSPARLARLLLAIGGIAACAGAAIGTLVGPVWSRALLTALGRAWNGAVAAGSTPAFTLASPSPAAIVPAGLAAAAVSLAAVFFAARRAAAMPPLALLRGGDEHAAGRRDSGRWTSVLALIALVAAGATVFAGRTAAAATAVGLFFTAGFAALVGLLAVVRLWLTGCGGSAGLRSLSQLAHRGLAHGSGRAFSVAAIVAIAEFLIVAVSAFAVRPPDDPAERRSPTGGWTTIATFGEPTSVDPSAPEAQGTLGLSAAEERAVSGCAIALLRSSGGDDASCTNLYAANRPAVLGVGPAVIARGGFSFVGHARPPAGDAGASSANPWRLLERAAGGPIPAILDQATAQWGLKLGGVGATFTMRDEDDRPVELEIVGLLEPGILQGAVIVAERDFQRMFPRRSGYGMALIDESGVEPARRDAVRSALAAAWADAGVSLASSLDRMRSLMAVQNTFLAGFQALGTLGLLLGTAGVAAVQLQGVVERLETLALLRAIGFTLGRIRLLVVLETLLTVCVGLAAGTAAGCLAIAPALAGGAAHVPLGWIAATCGLTLAVALLAALVAASRTVIPERPRDARG